VAWDSAAPARPRSATGLDPRNPGFHHVWQTGRSKTHRTNPHDPRSKPLRPQAPPSSATLPRDPAPAFTVRLTPTRRGLPFAGTPSSFGPGSRTPAPSPSPLLSARTTRNLSAAGAKKAGLPAPERNRATFALIPFNFVALGARTGNHWPSSFLDPALLKVPAGAVKYLPPSPRESHHHLALRSPYKRTAPDTATPKFDVRGSLLRR